MANTFQGSQGKSFDLSHSPQEKNVLQIGWQRKGYVLLGILAGLALGAVAFVLIPPSYESKAQLLVIRKWPDPVTGVDHRRLDEDYLATHQALLRSPMLVDRAARKGTVAELACFAQAKEDQAEAVLAAFSVTRSKALGRASDNVLSLAFQAPEPEQSAAALEAIIESYRDFLDETYRNTSQVTLKLIAQAKDEVHKEVTAREAAYLQFRKEAPLLWKGKDNTTLRQERLASIENKRATVMIRKVELEGQLAAIDSSFKKGGDRDALIGMIAFWASQTEVNKTGHLTLQEQLYPLLMEEQKVLQVHGTKSAEAEAIRKRIEITQTFLANPTVPWRPGVESTKESVPAPDPIEAYRRSCQQQLEHCKATEELLGDLFQKEHKSARELTSFELEDEGYRSEIERGKKLHESLIKQLAQIDLVKDMGGYEAQVISPPAAGKMVRPKALLVFPVAAFMGILAGLGLAFLAEIKDKSFRTPDEVRGSLGLPVVGHIPYFKAARRPRSNGAADGAALDRMLCVHHDPASPQAEAIREVRAVLHFGAQGHGCKVVQVTSPAEGEGKTVLAANLAVSLAQAGKRVLLIDADLRTPRLHHVFGLRADAGLGDALAGQAEASRLIQPSGIPGLSVLPCGAIPANAADLLMSPRLDEILRGVREQYDFVLVDSSALLTASDPRLVAQCVDGILLNVRLASNSRPAAERARELLETHKVPVIGVVGVAH